MLGHTRWKRVLLWVRDKHHLGTSGFMALRRKKVACAERRWPLLAHLAAALLSPGCSLCHQVARLGAVGLHLDAGAGVLGGAVAGQGRHPLPAQLRG